MYEDVSTIYIAWCNEGRWTSLQHDVDLNMRIRQTYLQKRYWHVLTHYKLEHLDSETLSYDNQQPQQGGSNHSSFDLKSFCRLSGPTMMRLKNSETNSNVGSEPQYTNLESMRISRGRFNGTLNNDTIGSSTKKTNGDGNPYCLRDSSRLAVSR